MVFHLAQVQGFAKICLELKEAWSILLAFVYEHIHGKICEVLESVRTMVDCIAWEGEMVHLL